MIKAKHKKILRKLFNIYIDWQLKRYFNNIFLLGEINIPKNDKSILVLPNHFSWWDGFFVDLIYRKFFNDYKLYMMVLEDTIKKFWFFNHIGAFTINPSNPKDIIKSFEYTLELLKDNKNFVVIFPQGELQPFSLELNLKPGVVNLILKKDYNFNLMFISMKILYSNSKKPDVYFQIGYSNNFSEYKFNMKKFVDDFHNNLFILEAKIKIPNQKKIKLL